MHEISEDLKEAGHANKRVALLIAILALGLAFAEAGSKSAQTSAISENVETSNLWAFFQAKTIRMHVLRTAIEAMQVELALDKDPALKEAKTKRIEEWKKAVETYNSDPQTKEGRKELSERATSASERRKLSMARYHKFEIASAAFQIGIVLASTAIITGVFILVWFAGILGAIGITLMGIALFIPQALHFF
jgi:hypothetical protein